MTDNEHNSNTGNVESGYEKSDAKPGRFALIGLVSIVIIVFIVIALNELFIYSSENQIHEVALKPESIKLREIRAHATEMLSNYTMVDSGKGIYRIPIERAMTLMVEEAFTEGQKKSTQ